MTTKIKTDWQAVKVGDVAGVLGGFAFPSKVFNTEKIGFPVIKISNISGGEIDTKNIEYVDVEKIERDISKFEIKKGDFLVAMTGATAGKVGKVNMDGVFFLNQRVGKFYSKDETMLDKSFLYYSVVNPRNSSSLKKLADGSAQGNMSSSQIETSLELAMPETMADQRRIVDILSAFDEKIENNNRIIKTLEEMAQAIFKEWFIDFRFHGYAQTEFIGSEFGRIPKGWEVKNVLEIVKRISVGKKYENKTALPTGNVPILDQGQSGCIGYQNDEPGVIASIDNPVVVFTNHTCNYRFITYPFSAIQNVLPYIGSNGYPTLFVYYLTRGKITMQEYKGHWPEFEQQEFLMPPVVLAKAFVSFVKPMVQKIVEAESENQKLATMRDILLPKLMSGELSV